MLKAPSTSLREGAETLQGISKMSLFCHGANLLGEVTVQIESASNSGKLGETVNDHEISVVLDGETTADLLQHGEGDVVKVLVGHDGQITLVGTNSGKVGALQRLELVGVEAEGAVDGNERVEGNGGDVAEGHVVGPDQVGEDGRDVTTVGLDVERVGDVTELHRNVVEVVVVGNHDSVDNSKVDTVKSLELSVLDVELAGLLDTGGEGQKLETSKGVPLDGVDLAELGERQSRENLELVEPEGTANDLEAVGRDGRDLGVVGCDKVTGDSLNTRERDGSTKARGDGDGTREGGAGREGRGISGRLDGGGTGDAARALGVGTADGSECRNKVLHRHCERVINCDAARQYGWLVLTCTQKRGRCVTGISVQVSRATQCRVRKTNQGEKRREQTEGC
jgi:hypothetical protein